MHREQHALLQDEGDAHIAWRAVVVDQEVGTDVQLAVVFLVEARRLLEVVIDNVVGNDDVKPRMDPALFVDGGRL